MSGKERIDQVLVERGAFPSRARAQGAIKAGLVRVNGAVVDKPSAAVASDASIEISGDVHDYVSRGALKLEKALRIFKIDPRGKTWTPPKTSRIFERFVIPFGDETARIF